MAGFLRPAQLASIRNVIERGFETSQDLFDVEVQFVRSGASGYATNGSPVKLIRIGFGLRKTSIQGELTPVTRRHADGDIQFWASDYTPKVGDRFRHEGMLCEITTVYPAEWDVITCEILVRQ